jgi:TRAP-type C4-dicarboxylate transport system permease small subunit
MKAFETLLRWMALAAGGVLLLLMFGTVADVVLRYFFNAPFRGSLELTEFAMALIVFLSIAYCGWVGAHIEVDLFDKWLSHPALRVLPAVLALVGALLFAVIAWLVTVEAFASIRQSSNMMKIPYFPFRMTAAFGSAVFAIVPQASQAASATAEPGKSLNMVLLPKFLGILPFDQAHQGAKEAAAELKNPTELQFLGPTPENSVAGQIEIITNATTQGVNAILISNNSGDQIVPAVKAAKEKGIAIVTWDSPIPSAEGEDVFVAQVDFSETGTVMADMALSILGADGGKFAILSASPDAAHQNAWIAAMKDALKDPKYAKL